MTQCTAATSELAPAVHCFDCLSFQAISRSILNCAPVNVNGAVNTSTPAFARCFAKSVISDSHSGAQSIFQGYETDTVLSVCIISAPHPSASCCSLTASERLVTACSASPSTCVWRAAAARQFASDCFPFSLSEFKLRCRKREVGAGRVVKWYTYTRSRTQTQSELPVHTQRWRPCAMRPFFIVIMTGHGELGANTTDLYSGSPLRREQVCVYVCVSLILLFGSTDCCCICASAFTQELIRLPWRAAQPSYFCSQALPSLSMLPPP